MVTAVIGRKEKRPQEKSTSVTFLVEQTQPNLTTLFKANFSMPYGLSGPTLSPIFDFFLVKTSLVRAFLTAPVVERMVSNKRSKFFKLDHGFMVNLLNRRWCVSTLLENF